MKTPHLVSACAAILILTIVLIGGTVYALTLEQRYVHALVGRFKMIDVVGSALPRAAVQQPDLLLMYGSSEIARRIPDYEASAVFQYYPTGFAPFEVAHAGMTSLLVAQQVSALGPSLQGKKIVISFTPSVFLSKMVSSDAYDGLFSYLHANELVFSPQLSFDVKQAAARRMLQYPATLDKDPVLTFALQLLAQDTLLSRALYDAVWPLGELQTTVIELQDHWHTVTYLAAHPDWQPDEVRRPGKINWPALEAQAQQFEVAHSTSNPFGIPNSIWLDQYHQQLPFKPAGSEDQGYVNALKHSLEWTDLDILLRILKQLGAQPLLLSRPVNGLVWQAMGVSEAARQVYYDKLQSIAAKYHVPVVDFQNHDTDKLFSIDTASHTSRLGWVYVDQTLDAFYHGTLR